MLEGGVNMPPITPKAPPFRLTPAQRAEIDAVRTVESKTMLLQIYHQRHCHAHRPIVGVFGSLDPRCFSDDWSRHEADHMAEAWAEYLGWAEIAEAAE